MKKLVSIIVPIYKIEDYIKSCIKSIVNQTYKNLEIILVDDGSPDNCPSICDDWAEKDSRIKVIHKQNEGLIEARKSGLRIATGDYVSFVDGDDWIEPDMYQNIADAIDEYNPDCVITQFYYSYPDREDKSRYCFDKSYYSRSELENEVFPKMLFDGKYYSFGVYPNCWTKVFKRDILEKNLYDVDSRVRMGEDIAFTYPCLMQCNSLAFVDKALYHYRINPQSMTKAYDDKLNEIIYLPYEALLNKSKENGVDLSQQLPYYLLYLVNFLIRNEANKNSKFSNKEKTALLNSIVNNEYVINEFSKIDASILPQHTKFLFNAINKKSVFLISQYMKMLRIIV